jgi:hypothetical protein
MGSEISDLKNVIYKKFNRKDAGNCYIYVDVNLLGAK